MSETSNLDRIMGIEMNNEVSIEINTTPTAETATYNSLCDMFRNYGLALNEQIYEAMYLADAGYGSSAVTGLKPVLTLSGDYNPNDPVCQYLNKARWGIGKARVTDIRMTRGGQTVSCPVTLTGIGVVGGESPAPNGVNLTIAFNGKPTVTDTVAGTETEEA